MYLADYSYYGKIDIFIAMVVSLLLFILVFFLIICCGCLISMYEEFRRSFECSPTIDSNSTESVQLNFSLPPSYSSILYFFPQIEAEDSLPSYEEATADCR